jgi:hypothetical protein
VDESDRELHSPPYPPASPTPQRLYLLWGQFREWLEEAVQEVPWSGGVPDVPPLPNETAFAMLGVMLHFRHCRFISDVRHAWDDLVRRYEDSWGARGRLQETANLLRACCRYMKQQAFLSVEYAEARQAKAERRMRRQQSRFEKFLRDFGG